MELILAGYNGLVIGWETNSYHRIVFVGAEQDADGGVFVGQLF